MIVFSSTRAKFKFSNKSFSLTPQHSPSPNRHTSNKSSIPPNQSTSISILSPSVRHQRHTTFRVSVSTPTAPPSAVTSTLFHHSYLNVLCKGAMSRAQALSPTSHQSQQGPIPSSLLSTLEDRTSTWDRRVQALQQLATLAKTTAIRDLHNVSRASFVHQLRLLSPHLALCLSDLRSSLVKEACLCIQTLAEILGAEFVLTVGDDVIPALLRRSAQTTKVIRESSVNAAKSMFVHGVNGVSFFAARLLSKTVLDRKNPALMRATAADFIGMILVEDCLSGLHVIGETIQAAIVGGCEDPDENVRAISRENWRRFDALDTTTSNRMLTKMSPQIVALIQKEKCSPQSAVSSPLSPPNSALENAATRLNGPRRANPMRATDSTRDEDDDESPRVSPTAHPHPKTLKPALRAVKIKSSTSVNTAKTAGAVMKKKRALPPRPMTRVTEADSKQTDVPSMKSRKSTHPILARPPRRSVMPNAVIDLQAPDIPTSKRARPQAARRSVPVNLLNVSREEEIVDLAGQAAGGNLEEDTEDRSLELSVPKEQRQNADGQISPIAKSETEVNGNDAKSPATQVKEHISAVADAPISSPTAQSGSGYRPTVSKLKRGSPSPKKASPSPRRTGHEMRQSSQSAIRSPKLSNLISKPNTSAGSVESTTMSTGHQSRTISGLENPQRFLKPSPGKHIEKPPMLSPSVFTQGEADNSPLEKPNTPVTAEKDSKATGSHMEVNGNGSSPGSVMSAKNILPFAESPKASNEHDSGKQTAAGEVGVDEDHEGSNINGNERTPQLGVASRKGRISYILGSNISPAGFFSLPKIIGFNSSTPAQVEESLEQSMAIPHDTEKSKSSRAGKLPDDEDQNHKTDASNANEKEPEGKGNALDKDKSTTSQNGALEEKDNVQPVEPLQGKAKPTADDVELLLNLGTQYPKDVDAISTSEIVGGGTSETMVEWDTLVREMEANADAGAIDKSSEDVPSMTSSGRSEPVSEKENEQPYEDIGAESIANDTDTGENSTEVATTASTRKVDDSESQETRIVGVSKSKSGSERPTLPQFASRKSVLPGRIPRRPPTQKSVKTQQASSKVAITQERHGVSRRKASMLPNSRYGDTATRVSTVKPNGQASTVGVRPKLGAPRRSVMPGTKIELKSDVEATNEADNGSVTVISQQENSRAVTLSSRMQVQKRKPLSPKIQGVVDWLRKANKSKSGGWQERCKALEGFGEACKQLEGEHVGSRLAEDCVCMLGDFIQDMHHRVSSSALDGLFFLLLCSEGSSVAFQKALEKKEDVLRRILGLLGSSRENVRLAAGRVMQSFDVQFTPEVAVSLIMRAMSSSSVDPRRGGSTGNPVVDGRVAERGCDQLAHAFERASASGVGFVWKTAVLEGVLRGMAEMRKDRRVAVRRSATRVTEAVRKSLPPGAFELACEKYL